MIGIRDDTNAVCPEDYPPSKKINQSESPQNNEGRNKPGSVAIRNTKWHVKRKQNNASDVKDNAHNDHARLYTQNFAVRWHSVRSG